MEPIGGRTPTGRQFAGPCTDLVELVDSGGTRHTCLVFHERWRDSTSLGAPMDRVRGLMAQTGVIGLPSLVDVDTKRGAWVYNTGSAWSVAEIVHALADAGESGSVRAGLELCYLAAEVLLEAQDMGSAIGLRAHGSLDPQRLLVRNDGQVVVLGYGLPAPDVDSWLENSRTPIKEDSLRYAPPERFDGQPLDISSDLFTLTLVGIELMVGKPVYDGLFDDIAAQARNGDAVRRIYGWRDALPPTVQEALLRALKPDRDARYRDGVEYLYAIHDLLSSIDADGPPLVEIVARYRGLTSRDRMVAAKATGTYSMAELAELTADLGDVEAHELRPPKHARPVEEVVEAAPEEGQEAERWSSRGGTERRSGGQRLDRAKAATTEPEAKSDAREDLRNRLKRSRSAPDPADVGPSDDDNDPRARLRRRLRERSSPSEVEESPSRPRRRGGRSASAAPEAEPPADPKAIAPPEPEVPGPAPEAPAVAAPVPVVAAEPQRDPDPPSAAASAAALLERLRGGGVKVSVAAPAPAVAPAPVPVATPNAVPASAVPVAEVGPPEDEDAEPVADPVEPETTELPVAPPAPAPAPGAGRVTAVGPDGTKVVLALGPSSLHIAAEAADLLGLGRVDLSGRLERTWVFDGELAPGAELDLVPVENTIEIREITVGNTQFRAPVGRAVPAVALIGHIRAWLRLPAGDWALEADGGLSGPDDVIDDLPDGPLVVTKGG